MNSTNICSTCQTPAAPTDHYCAACGALLRFDSTWTSPVVLRSSEPDFIPLAVTPIFDEPEPTGIRRLADRFSLPRLRHG